MKEPTDYIAPLRILSEDAYNGLVDALDQYVSNNEDDEYTDQKELAAVESMLNILNAYRTNLAE